MNMTPFCLRPLLTAEKLRIREFAAFLSVTSAQNVVLFSWSMKSWTSTGNPLEIKLFLCCPNYNTLTWLCQDRDNIFLKYLLYGLLFKADFGESHESGKLVREIPLDTDAFVRSNDNPFNEFLCKLRCQFYQSLIRGNLFDS